jgi:colanic acid/amylovoran biosynthesis protein
MMPNSIGPIHKGLGRRLTKFVLGRVHTLYVRESISKNYLKEIGINSTLSADLGFYCKAVTEGTPTLKSVKKKIGVTLRPYRFPENKNAGAKYLKYVESISEFCKSNQNYKYYFIVQVQGPSAHENDLIAINDVISNLTSSVDYEVVDGDYNYRQLIGIYSQLDYLIGTRFHSVIFSMLSNVPCIAIAYGGNKTFGIMNSAGLKDYVVDIANISKESIEKKFLAVLNDKDYFSQWSGFIEKSNRERSLMVKTIQDVISS